MFRPLEKARRFATSAERMAMTAVPEELFIEVIETLVKVERDWIDPHFYVATVSPWLEFCDLPVREGPLLVLWRPTGGGGPDLGSTPS